MSTLARVSITVGPSELCAWLHALGHVLPAAPVIEDLYVERDGDGAEPRAITIEIRQGEHP